MCVGYVRVSTVLRMTVLERAPNNQSMALDMCQLMEAVH
jgi:hypothetical protein